MRKIVPLLGAASALALAAVLASTASADAAPANCDKSGHCYSIARSAGTGPLTGISATWANSWFSVSDNATYESAHLSKEMWLKTPEKGWVEVGIMDGWEYSGSSELEVEGVPGAGCNCQVYALFWADGSRNGDFQMHIIKHMTPDDSVHTYSIERIENAGTSWSISVDGQQIGVSKMAGSFTGNYGDFGYELQAPNTTTPTSLINHSCISNVKYKDNDLKWNSLSNANTSADPTFYGTTWDRGTSTFCSGKGNG